MAAEVKAPCRIQVAKIVASRYANHTRPAQWDSRISGVDVIQTVDQKTVRLLSDGGQSPPKEGWVLLLASGDSEAGFKWTLSGMS